MKFLHLFLENFYLNLKVLSLHHVRHYFSKKHYVHLIILFALNVITAFVKILAPATMAKAIEMIALNEDDYSIGKFSLSATHLLYLSVAFMVWVKSELHIKRMLSREFENLQIKNNIMSLIKTAHHIPFKDYQANTPYITQALLEVINHQSKLTTEVATTVVPSLLDVIIGLSIMWRRYGHVIGVEFCSYLILDVFLLSFLVNVVTGVNSRFIRTDKALSKLINHEYEVMNFEETVRTFHHEVLEVSLSHHLVKKYLTASARFLFAEDLASLLKIIPLIIANIIPITYLMKEQLSINDLDDFIFILSYINLFGGSMNALTAAMKNCQKAMLSIEKQQDFHETYNTLNQPIPLGNFPTLHLTSPHIEFINVVFCYPGNSRPILNNVSFQIHPGQCVGIIGRSNAGKSTIVKLLFGLYSAQSGQIRLNGHAIQDIPKQVLAKIFCCIPQAAELFRNRSLKYNVIYGCNNEDVIYNYATQKRNEAATKYHTVNLSESDLEADLHEDQFIDMQFKEAMINVQLGSVLADNVDSKNSAVGLSGGQRQRISLARALLRHSSVFIFDEVTSALDSFTEAEVLQNIKQMTRHKTTLMITHRISTIRHVDQVLVIEDGKLVEQGHPEMLLERRGIFHNYCKAQHGPYP